MLSALGWGPLDADALIARLPRSGPGAAFSSPAALLAALGQLELEGRVERLPDGRFRQLPPS